jgi:DME family drug/metabolite transporter
LLPFATSRFFSLFLMNKRGYLFILAGAVLWGTTGTAQALAPHSAQPLAVGALRLVVGGMILLVVFLFGPGRAVCPLSRWRLPLAPTLLAAVCMAAYQVLFFAGVRLTGVAIGTIVGIGSSPVLAGLLGYLFRGERPGWRWGSATLLAVGGCGLLATAGKDIHVDPLGMLLAVGAGAAYAIFSLLSKNMLERQPVELVMAAVFGLGAVLLAPFLITQDLSWLANPRGIVAILHLGLFATALAYILFGKGLRLVPLATAVTLSLAEPLTAGTLAVLLLGEKLSPQASLGILLIFSGLVVLSLPGQANPARIISKSE